MSIMCGVLTIAAVVLAVSLGIFYFFNRKYKKINRELDASREQLRHVSKLAELGQMISSIAHEINNPMTSIIGFSQFVIDADCSNEIKSDVRLIHENAIWCRDIIRNILLYSQKKEDLDVKVKINDILEEAINFRSFVGKDAHVRIIRDFQENIPLIKVNPQRLKEVFINIINNAYDAMETRQNRKNELLVKSFSDENKIIIKFSDSGPGIEPNIRPRVFDSFFTTKKEKGTGLGLSISKDIVNKYGGVIFLESRENKGTTFTIEFPMPYN